MKQGSNIFPAELYFRPVSEFQHQNNYELEKTFESGKIYLGTCRHKFTHVSSCIAGV